MMMRLAIVSDTHDNWPLVVDAIKAEGNIDYLIFLGDYVSDGRQMEKALQIPTFLVRGNCDSYEDGRGELVVELGGWRLLLCHGHFYSVKETLEELYVHGVEEQVDFVLFGHTHQAYYREGEVVMINPGSVSKFNLMLNDASWGLLTLSKEKNEKNFIKYEKKTCQML